MIFGDTPAAALLLLLRYRRFAADGHERGLPHLGSDLVDAFLRFLALARTGQLADHLIIIDDCGAVMLLLIVILGDVERARCLLLREILQVRPGLRDLFTVRITE